MAQNNRCNFIMLFLAWTFAIKARADFQPITLSAESYNQDMVVEKTAPPPVLAVTSASMDTGAQNSGFTWFEQGYINDSPWAGLPSAGSTFTSEQSADHQYRLVQSYLTNNALLIDPEHPNAVITFLNLSNYTALSFLTSSGTANNEIGYSLLHQDGTRDTGKFISPNWYSPLDPAWAANGCVNTVSFTLSDLNSYNPKLYSVDIYTADLSPVIEADLYLSAGTAHAAVFAVSGATVAGGPFDPVEIAGYNQDMVIEAGALKPGFLETNTTATMDNGTTNLRCTWYEQGYNPADPQSGLPAAGSLVTSETDAAHRFLMAPSYNAPNAILLDKVNNRAVLNLPTPASYSVISFLTASAFGPITNQCVFVHADGNSETNGFISPDWLGQTPGAVSTHGRVSVSTRLLDQVSSNSPRLYAADVSLANQTSPVTSIILSPKSCPTQSHAAVFAVSGIPTNSVTPMRLTLTITKNPNGTIDLRSSQPATLQYCASLPSSKMSWTAAGLTASAWRLTNNYGEKVRFFRLIIP